MPRAKKRGPGRPALGRLGRTAIVPVRFTSAELAAIEAVVRSENAEAKRDGDDGPQSTVSSWIREHSLEPLGLAEHGGEE